MTGLVGPVLAAFEPPTTHDFVWDCWGPGLKIGGLEFCMNFVYFIVLLGFLAMIAFFYFGLRRPKVVPGKLQSLVELGVQFVRENIGQPMLGADTARFMPLLVTLFFAIFFWNVWEIVPGINFSSNSRIAFPLVMATIAWVIYNTVGIMKHGFFGYLKHVLSCRQAHPPIAVHPAGAHRVHHPDHHPADHPVGPSLGQLRGGALPAGGLLPRGPSRWWRPGLPTIVFAPFSFAIAVVLVGFELFVSALQAFIFAILTASYIGGAMAEEH